jgi:hypothetical protein
MPARTWKFGFFEVTTAKDVPENAVVDKAWRLPMSASNFANPLTRREMQSLYQAVGGTLGSSPDLSSRAMQTQVVNRINAALSRGQMVAFRRRADASVANAGTPGTGATPAPAPPPPPRSADSGGSGPEPEKTWIEIQLVDEEGNPVAGERYILKITDGSIREGTLDASGKVSVRGIDPGTCTVRFPDLDAREYKRKN